jgi:hypothetical protein
LTLALVLFFRRLPAPGEFLSGTVSLGLQFIVWRADSHPVRRFRR